MDPLSQGVLGAVAAQSFATKKHVRVAAVTGWLGGMAADLDILIKSSTDPLYSLEMHRHFTHSLAFIPIGGLIVALGLWLLFYKKKHDFKLIYLFATLGYATHGLLDSCTSYGTRLLWPFSDYRVSWDNVAIVDPLFTIPTLIMASIAMRKHFVGLSRVALIYAIAYLSFGAWQNHKVDQIIYAKALERGHTIEKLKLNPTIGNLIVWRTVYKVGDEFVMDAIRMPVWGQSKFYEGTTIPAFKMPKDIPADSVLAKDIARFSYFSQGFIYTASENVIADARYSMTPNDMVPLWGINIDPNNPQDHVTQAHLRGGKSDRLGTVWEMFKDEYQADVKTTKTLE
jgi:inner membrane protein